jgi:Fic family protein
MDQGTSSSGAPAREVYRPFPNFGDWDVSNFDPALADRYRALLAETKRTASPEDFARAVRVQTRAAAVDTGAIEGLYATDRGFTMTVAAEAASWEWEADKKGAHVRQTIEDALRAFDWVLDAATKHSTITEVWIRSLHELACSSQETYRALTAVGWQDLPLPKGVYKTQPNNPLNRASGVVHAYAPPSDTPAEMHRLVEQLVTPEFAAAHPVVQAAYAHYAFVCVHPFADGNGRVSRALASVFLYRDPGVPLVVFDDQRDLYLDALETADHGNPVSFVQFISDRLVDTVSRIAQPRRAGRHVAERPE